MGGTNIQPTPPIDYSAAMMQMGQMNQQVQMAGIGAQIMNMQLMSADRQDKIQADLTLGLDKLDTQLQIAKMNFQQQMIAEEDRHDEKMESLDVKRLGIEKMDQSSFDPTLGGLFA